MRLPQTLRNTEKAEIIRDDTQDLAEESSLFNTRAHRAAEHLQHVSARGAAEAAVRLPLSQSLTLSFRDAGKFRLPLALRALGARHTGARSSPLCGLCVWT